MFNTVIFPEVVPEEEHQQKHSYFWCSARSYPKYQVFYKNRQWNILFKEDVQHHILMADLRFGRL